MSDSPRSTAPRNDADRPDAVRHLPQRPAALRAQAPEHVAGRRVAALAVAERALRLIAVMTPVGAPSHGEIVPKAPSAGLWRLPRWHGGLFTRRG